MSIRYKQRRRERYYSQHFQRLEAEGGCWCGEPNPHFAPLRDCGGAGYVNCICGGDFCVCHHHGEAECLGCPDCEQDDDDDHYPPDN